MPNRVHVSFTTNISAPKARVDKLEGRDHFVIPCVSLTEGVHTGSHGPIYYPAEEIQNSVEAWNHMPAVLYHPQENGVNISARQPVVLNTRKMGVLLNSVGDGGKLSHEVWADVERTKSLDVRVHEAVQNGTKVEVSTGLSMDLDPTPGEWNGQKFVAIARNMRPDHLAILPDKVGACSIAKGAGLFANEAKEPESIQQVLFRTVENALKSVGAELTTNELSFNDITRSLSDLLSAKYGKPGQYWDGWVCDVFPTYVVFRSGDGPEYWMQDYKASDSGVELVGEAKKVNRVVQYRVPNGGVYTANESGGVSLESTGMPFDKTAHVNALISNGIFAEAERAELLKMPDAMVEKIKLPAAPAVPATPQVHNDLLSQLNAIIANNKPVVPAGTTPAKSVTEYIANAPVEMRPMLAGMMKGWVQQKQSLIANITAIQGQPFSPEFLAGKDVEELQGLLALAQAAGAQAGLVGNSSNHGGGYSMFNPGFNPNQGGIFGPAAFTNYGPAAGAGGQVNNGADDTEPLGSPNLQYENPFSRKLA